MAEFPTRHVDRSQFQLLEQLGSKRKFWFIEDNRRLLFKAEDRGTGDDWAEVVACHLCRLLGLPHVEYELALECDGAQELGPGAICENMTPDPLQLILGNELLLARDPQYPAVQRFKVKQHTVEAVTGIVHVLEPPAPAWLADVPAGIESALDYFVGYVMLDAWIANPDRHHENWAAIWDGSAMRLAPTFDHGAALARNLLDSDREERLTTKDRNRTVEMFAQKGRSGFFGSADDPKPLELRETFQAFGRAAPNAAKLWLQRLRLLNEGAICGIVERVPANRMSETGKRFTIELLAVNQRRLLELV
jgi:hypothetical protein